MLLNKKNKEIALDEEEIEDISLSEKDEEIEQDELDDELEEMLGISESDEG